jgi:hypothetical protein
VGIVIRGTLDHFASKLLKCIVVAHQVVLALILVMDMITGMIGFNARWLLVPGAVVNVHAFLVKIKTDVVFGHPHVLMKGKHLVVIIVAQMNKFAVILVLDFVVMNLQRVMLVAPLMDSVMVIEI